jgi:DNA invertase Pin-like site-specific DNA recombinase
LGYVRVSREEQAEGDSPRLQEDRLRAYAALYGLELLGVVPDLGASGKSLDRPGVRAALAALDDGRADGLLVAKLDRLTRSVRDLAELLETYFGERRGFALISVNEQIDTRTANGRMMLRILTTVAEWERETIVERTAEALRFKRQAGQRTGGVPYGSAVDPDGPRNKKGRPVDAEQAGLDRLVALAAAGGSLRGIAAGLDAAGFPPKRAARWSAAAVARPG